MSITISDTTPRVQYTAANTQTTFAIPWQNVWYLDWLFDNAQDGLKFK